MKSELPVHTYGDCGPLVIVLHGGPAAFGSAASLARELGNSFKVFEPWQRGSGSEPLTVARHVQDLYELVNVCCSGARPAIVGESWGAMLALAYAAEHPNSAGPLVLIGCGTFDMAARALMQATLEERTTDELRECLKHLPVEFPNPGEEMQKRHQLCERLYSYEPIVAEPGQIIGESFDIRAHTETWNDMVRLQEEGIYPAAFSAIKSPVLMLHGTYDPHPGRMILASLTPHLPQIEYHEWKQCGHRPWLERFIRDEFFTFMEDWLARHCFDAVSNS